MNIATLVGGIAIVGWIVFAAIVAYIFYRVSKQKPVRGAAGMFRWSPLG